MFNFNSRYYSYYCELAKIFGFTVLLILRVCEVPSILTVFDGRYLFYIYLFILYLFIYFIYIYLFYIFYLFIFYLFTWEWVVLAVDASCVIISIFVTGNAIILILSGHKSSHLPWKSLCIRARIPVSNRFGKYPALKISTSCVFISYLFPVSVKNYCLFSLSFDTSLVIVLVRYTTLSNTGGRKIIQASLGNRKIQSNKY